MPTAVPRLPEFRGSGATQQDPEYPDELIPQTADVLFIPEYKDVIPFKELQLFVLIKVAEGAVVIKLTWLPYAVPTLLVAYALT